MYVNPFGLIDSGLTAGRIDNGVDYFGPVGAQLVAPGDCIVYAAYAAPPGQAGRNDAAWLAATFLNGPLQGKSFYFGESLRPTVQAGSYVSAGQVFALLTGAARGIEVGWAAGPAHPQESLAFLLGQQTDPTTGSGSTAAGASWNAFMVSLGAPGGQLQGQVGGTMPAGYDPNPPPSPPPANRRAAPVAPPPPPKPLGPWKGTYRPDYQLTIYEGGDPSRQLTGVNLRSVTSIRTAKSLDNISGTFDITLKDRRAQLRVKPMDVVRIRLKGHNQGWGIVLLGVVDGIEPDGESDVASSQADITISGRCTAKYLQINSMFLPVWDPQANIPTALIFGKGDASQKLGTGVNAYTPREIFGYIFDHFVVGLRNRVGLSGTPNARYWLNRTNRFEWVKDAGGKTFQIPFVQFDEDTTDQALTRLVIQGFTEGWVDEVGNIVYRPPAWDAPVTWNLHTGGLRNWSLPESDVAMATYVEVFPGALPAIPSGVAQAMMAGRAPIPSDYVTGLQNAGFKSIAGNDFIIDTDKSGKVTANGARNWYYQRQKKYGLRPYQITSPLLASREQAQAQAEGLLRFLLRWDKSGSVTIPGEPGVRLGTTIYLHGPLEDQQITRTYYVQGIAHEYVEGDHYTTTLTLSHGRDPGDPSWQQMMLPNFDPSQLSEVGGLLSPKTGTGRPSSFTTPVPSYPGTPNSRGVINPIPGWTIGRDDMGVDADAAPGTPIYAPADCTLVEILPNWYAQQPLLLFRFDQSLPGAPADYWYAAEQLTPASTRIGTVFRQGQAVAIFASSGTGIEIGWGDPTANSRTLAGAAGRTWEANPAPGQPTPDGESFKAYFGIA